MERWERRGGEGKRIRREGRGGDLKSWLTPNVNNPEKYPDCRTDLIADGSNRLALGGKHPHTATANSWCKLYDHVVLPTKCFRNLNACQKLNNILSCFENIKNA